jgi:aryl sulfotransferase
MERTRLNAWGELPATIQNHSIDSLRWRLVNLRDGDVVVASWAKAGTTWLQQVVTQMVYGIGGRYMLPRVAPWVDSPYVPEERLARMESGDFFARRVFKSHLDAKAVPYCEMTKYIYVARDGRDVLWSWYQHHRRLRPAVYEAMDAFSSGKFASLPPPNEDFNIYFREWMEKDGFPLWPFWSHVGSWWNLRQRSNVLILHYEDILSNPGVQIVRIAAFLGVPFRSEDLENLLVISSREFMAKNITWISPDISLGLKEGGETFFTGTRRGWRDILSDADVSLYLDTAAAKLGDELAAWLVGRTR